MCSINNFQIIEKIGEGKWFDMKITLVNICCWCYKKTNEIFFFSLLGTYGVVYKAHNLKTGKMIALKRIRLEKYVHMCCVNVSFIDISLVHSNWLCIFGYL